MFQDKTLIRYFKHKDIFVVFNDTKYAIPRLDYFVKKKDMILKIKWY
jgi:hypothetical protein